MHEEMRLAKGILFDGRRHFCVSSLDRDERNDSLLPFPNFPLCLSLFAGLTLRGRRGNLSGGSRRDKIRSSFSKLLLATSVPTPSISSFPPSNFSSIDKIKNSIDSKGQEISKILDFSKGGGKD